MTSFMDDPETIYWAPIYFSQVLELNRAAMIYNATSAT
jgi:hypothetical protein